MPSGQQLSKKAGKKGLTGEKAQVAEALATESKSDGPSVQEIKSLEKEAQKKLDKMSNEDRTALLEKMGKRVEILMKLPAEARMTHMAKLNHEEQLEFVSAQVLISTIQQHMAS
eukprot:TRINITY_DN23852_c0_g1_i1.p1 TRINITY_DN23852_c0_g1~~TRINITY_DN23852_c0_g1_i1.p1  ORF type:complete len:114 (-),score=24.87 TRINITY_DN23852_c0_g1_i1:45-386(-)